MMSMGLKPHTCAGSDTQYGVKGNRSFNIAAEIFNEPVTIQVSLKVWTCTGSTEGFNHSFNIENPCHKLRKTKFRPLTHTHTHSISATDSVPSWSQYTAMDSTYMH